MSYQSQQATLTSDEASGAHTPGPWVAHRQYVGVPRHLSAIAICKDKNGFIDNPDELAISNARLIAAAPELLALAKKLAGECADCGGTGDNSNDEPGNNPRDCEACADIREVIAKAEGSK